MTLIRCILPMTPPLHSFSGSLLPSGTLWSPWRLWETWATLMQFGADKTWEKRTFSLLGAPRYQTLQSWSLRETPPNHNYWTWSIQRQSWIFPRYWRLSWWDGSLTKITFWDLLEGKQLRHWLLFHRKQRCLFRSSARTWGMNLNHQDIPSKWYQ